MYQRKTVLNKKQLKTKTELKRKKREEKGKEGRKIQTTSSGYSPNCTFEKIAFRQANQVIKTLNNFSKNNVCFRYTLNLYIIMWRNIKTLYTYEIPGYIYYLCYMKERQKVNTN